MKRRTFLVCTAALFCGALLAGGCTQKTSQPVLQQIEYSNLADSDTQALLSKLLQDAGVSDLRIQTFFDHVQKFNNAVDPAWLTTGFENAKPLDLKYDPYSMQDAWTEKYDTFPGWNCRITACGLFGDFITVTGKADLDSAEDTLFMDYETLDSDPESLCGDERQKFDALFAPVKTTNTTDIPTHLKTIQQEWKKRGLSFVEDDKIRLVSVVLHDQFSETDNSLMIGHVGVMLPTSDAVYFVEKVAFQEPYRLLKFKNRTELSDYLKLNVMSYTLATISRALVAVAGYMGSGNVTLMLLFTAIAALGQGPWQGDMNAAIAACSEYTWLTKHKRVDGTMYSCTSLGVKLGGGLGTAITGWLLAASHFDSALTVQPDSCINMLKIMYLVIPFALDAIITFILSRMKVEEANEKLRAAV